tara:strand:+ start:164 stop:1219 length:1056 start_codon:yes stop_codon:yes gene_type:complete
MTFERFTSNKNSGQYPIHMDGKIGSKAVCSILGICFNTLIRARKRAGFLKGNGKHAIYYSKDDVFNLTKHISTSSSLNIVNKFDGILQLDPYTELKEIRGTPKVASPFVLEKSIKTEGVAEVLDISCGYVHPLRIKHDINPTILSFHKNRNVFYYDKEAVKQLGNKVKRPKTPEDIDKRFDEFIKSHTQGGDKVKNYPEVDKLEQEVASTDDKKKLVSVVDVVTDTMNQVAQEVKAEDETQPKHWMAKGTPEREILDSKQQNNTPAEDVFEKVDTKNDGSLVVGVVKVLLNQASSNGVVKSQVQDLICDKYRKVTVQVDVTELLELGLENVQHLLTETLSHDDLEIAKQVF